MSVTSTRFTRCIFALTVIRSRNTLDIVTIAMAFPVLYVASEKENGGAIFTKISTLNFNRRSQILL